MTEKILRIEEFNNKEYDEPCYDKWFTSTESGFKVVTDKQEIILSITDDDACCEEWGYFLTNDEVGEFIGADLLNVTLTDTALNTLCISKISQPSQYNTECEVMFVNIETSNGPLQFTAYNTHNGYYGRKASVKSMQLYHEAEL